MQNKNHILITISLIIMQCQNVSSIDWKFPFLIALLAPQSKSECTIYNRAEQTVTIQDNSYDLWWTKKISQTQIPEKSKTLLYPCIHLNILADEKTAHIKELNYHEQPHGWSSAYTITEKPCETDCTHITKTLQIKPGVPEEFTYSLQNLTPQEIRYVEHQLRHHPKTINNEQSSVCKNSQLRRRKP